MARETKEEKELRRAAEEHMALLAMEEYRKNLPKRMMESQALASEVGVETCVTLIASGPSVSFRWSEDNNGYRHEDTVTYETEEWELDHVETKLRDLKAAKIAAQLRLQMAKDIYSKLSEIEQACLKEFIHYLR
jgi:hypothetical protein